MSRRSTHGLAIFAALCLTLAIAKEPVFVMPRAFHAKTYPAHDAHDDEKFTIAADPYDMPDKEAKAFVTDFRRAGFVPIHVIFSNDGDQGVNLSKMNMVLITKDRVKIVPADTGDIYRRISKQAKRGDEPGIPMPIPLPRSKPRSISKQAEAEVEGSQFLAHAIEPHNTRGGFFFFDVEGFENPLAGARLEITGIRNNEGNELFYFELPMEKYLGYDPLKH
jgi:hypothetical protein